MIFGPILSFSVVSLFLSALSFSSMVALCGDDIVMTCIVSGHHWIGACSAWISRSDNGSIRLGSCKRVSKLVQMKLDGNDHLWLENTFLGSVCCFEAFNYVDDVGHVLGSKRILSATCCVCGPVIGSSAT